jgi:hypothetical protein
LLDEEQEAAAVQTVKDGVEFFVRKDLTKSAIKFLPFNYAETGNYAPYELSMAKVSKKVQDQFTMSRHGLVHTKTGVKGMTSVTTLDQWMSEASHFNLARQLGLFKNYLAIKCLRGWQNYVSHKLYLEKRQALASNLFLGMETFYQPAMELNKVVAEMSETHLMEPRPCLDADQAKKMNLFALKKQKAEKRVAARKRRARALPDGVASLKVTAASIRDEELLQLEDFAPKACTLNDYVDHQNKIRQNASEALEAGIDQIQAILSRLYTTVVDLGVLEGPLTELQELEVIGATKPGKMKGKSMHRERLDKLARSNQMERASKEDRMVVSFIRLADLMVVECLAGVGLRTLSNLLVEMDKSDTFKSGMFVSTFGFSPAAAVVVVSPPEAETTAPAVSTTPAVATATVATTTTTIATGTATAVVGLAGTQAPGEEVPQVPAEITPHKFFPSRGDVMGTLNTQVEESIRAASYVSRLAFIQPPPYAARLQESVSDYLVVKSSQSVRQYWYRNK